MKIRRAEYSDISSIYRMYKSVSAEPGGLARDADEIDENHVQNFIEKSLKSGLTLVAESEKGEIVAELHAYSPGIRVFSHILSDLTIAVSSECRGQGIARKLFQDFFNEIEKNMPHIKRVELFARESNKLALAFYESLGFNKEGKLRNRVRNTDGTLESDIVMGWLKKQ